MAQGGGIGWRHRYETIEEQPGAVRAVKRFESGIVGNPNTMTPDQTLADALDLMLRHKISGIPVVERSATGTPGKLVGILTNRDVSFAEHMKQPVAELLPRANLATVKHGVSREEARRLLQIGRA